MEVAAGHDHISGMNLDELIEAGAQAGLVSSKAVTTVISSSATYMASSCSDCAGAPTCSIGASRRRTGSGPGG